ncbi:methyltransferase domain-containing protein [Helicobacter pullorum]|uniref:methyltransferase domain-containing protein n=1 Tax=Helicobacter pullorum TaxID=35818 RepID=UPI000AA12BE9|nr:class I SAM-dependent methyltransferase [Helicobacter pullorum]
MSISVYDEEFYRLQSDGSYKSAKEIIPFIANVIPNIQSVLDVGCGVGTWLKVWQEYNKAIKIYGVDGNSVVDGFFIDKEHYRQIDLTSKADNITGEIKNFSKQERFDIVESLEVAEHLSEENAGNFVELLVSLSDVVLFSAAIPGQGGVEHINEQPPKYWANLFFNYDYLCFDIREVFWENKNIEFWYRQNIFLYIHKNKLNSLKLEYTPTRNPMHIVHPEAFCINVGEKSPSHNKNKGLMLYLRHPKKIFKK